MERTEYPAMLALLQPGEAVELLNDRVGHAGRLNLAIAEWLAERRRLEELYANGLRKLARKNLENLDFGIFSVPWSTLTTATEDQAKSHASLASKIEVDVERPLRNFADTNREMTAMSTMQGNLAALAKDVDRTKQKLDKLQTKGDRADSGKVAGASSELDGAQSQWESQAPYVFESLQALDETRLNHLRDVLTQLQTHEVDQVEKNRVTAEHCLNVLLTVETADEIKTFALKSVANRPIPDTLPRSDPTPAADTSDEASAASTSAARAQALASLAPEEDPSNPSPSIPEEEKKKKGPLQGLKRLGTVMGRRNRDSKAMSRFEPMADSPEKKSRPSPFSSLSRSGRSKREMLTLDPPDESSAQQFRPSPLRVGSEVLEPSSSTRDGPSSPSPAQRRKSAAGGFPPTAPLPPLPAMPTNIPNGGHGGDLVGLEPPKPNESQPSSAETRRDNEGFSLPPRDADPISQAQQDAAAAGDGTSPQFNVNIRNAPIQDEGGVDTDAALASMANKLQMQAPPSNRRSIRGRRDGRYSTFMPTMESPPPELPAVPSIGTSDATTAGPASSTQPPETQPTQRAVSASEPTASASSAPTLPPQAPQATPSQPAASIFSSFPPATETASPFRPASRAIAADHAGTDAQSVRSGRSLTSTTSQPTKHPDLPDAGLNVSIVETVSARFENGRLTSSSLIGEIALAHNPQEYSTPSGTETIKLDNFATLEKVAPNPVFANPAPAGKEGEYTVNLASISKTQVAFKYQARLDDTGAHAPLLLTPAFRIEPAQASVIVSYSLNPSFELRGRDRVAISNVTLALTLDGARATACQSKPVGTFARDKNLIFWHLGDLELVPGNPPEKLLARFATESEARSGSVEAKWDLVGDQAAALGSGIAVSAQGQAAAAASADAADPFADDGGAAAGWKKVKTVKKVTSGNYAAK